MLATFGTFISIYYLPLYYQFARGATAVQTSVHLLPFILFLVVFILFNGQFMGRTGYYYPWYIAGSALELIGGVLMCMLHIPHATPNPNTHTKLQPSSKTNIMLLRIQIRSMKTPQTPRFTATPSSSAWVSAASARPASPSPR